MKGFRLLGKAVRHGEGYEAPAGLWKQCTEDGTIQALSKYSTSPGRELIGLTDGPSFDGETQLYYVATIYVVFFSFLYTALAIGFPPYYLQVVIKSIPFGFAVSYVISTAINPIAMKLSYWTCSKDTEKK